MPTRNPSQLRGLEDLEASLGDDMLHAEMPIETVREYLRLAGGDPERIRHDAALLVDAVLGQSGTPPVRTARPGRRPSRIAFGRMNKEQLIRHVNALRGNPAAERALRSRLSNTEPEIVSEEELRAILEEFQNLFEEDEDETK